MPAAPAPAELSQADGSKVKVFLRDDEFYSWNEDADGYTIAKDTVTKDWVYSEKDSNGALKKTSHKVGRADSGRLRLSRHLLDDKGASAARAMRNERDSFRRRPAGGAAASGPAPASSVSISGAQPLTAPSLPADGPQGTLITQVLCGT